MDHCNHDVTIILLPFINKTRVLNFAYGKLRNSRTERKKPVIYALAFQTSSWVFIYEIDSCQRVWYGNNKPSCYVMDACWQDVWCPWDKEYLEAFSLQENPWLFNKNSQESTAECWRERKKWDGEWLHHLGLRIKAGRELSFSHQCC